MPTLRLPRAELDRIEEKVLAETRGSCRHCGACTRVCPQGINVADMLRYHAYVHNYGERDVASAAYEKLGKERAHLCMQCGACQAACPESIGLPGVISSVRIELA